MTSGGLMGSPVAVAFLVLIGPILLAFFTYWMRQRERKADFIRQDTVAKEAKRQQDEVAAQAAADRLAAEKRQDEVAEQAAEVARLLLEGARSADVAHGHKTEEVVGKSLQSRTLVTLAHPNGERQEVLLAGIPSIGDHIRLKNGRSTAPFIVEYILWVEGDADPVVVVMVGLFTARKRASPKQQEKAETQDSA